MLVDDNQGWSRDPFDGHNSEVVCMREILTAQQYARVNACLAEL